MLNQMQQEILREHMNVYVGQAAGLLSEMLNKRIHLTTPELFLLTHSEADQATYEQIKPSLFNSHVVASSLQFGSGFSGNAQLVFPQDKSQQLVRLCLGEADLLTAPAGEEGAPATMELTDTDFDAIREIGNVILNAVVGAMGNLLKVKLEYSLPEVHTFYFPEKEKDLLLEQNSHVLVICNTFAVGDFHIEGALLVVLGLESVMELVQKLDEMLAVLEAEDFV